LTAIKATLLRVPAYPNASSNKYIFKNAAVVY